ncbi:hypothetical protein M0813_02640 [Anaeramoeba flamelloides]|uniref:Tyrosine-protein kinase ephrin type A/B receptor-like domain-containing protein n=1 Tax=Anaeramoeba flamelloides TaxID=1746091 RepID=A0ABQ8YDX3_9EUKA|nr:hypothetical protein M0813_02640 [Anaeramoeba flamelloides]
MLTVNNNFKRSKFKLVCALLLVCLVHDTFSQESIFSDQKKEHWKQNNQQRQQAENLDANEVFLRSGDMSFHFQETSYLVNVCNSQTKESYEFHVENALGKATKIFKLDTNKKPNIFYRSKNKAVSQWFEFDSKNTEKVIKSNYKFINHSDINDFGVVYTYSGDLQVRIEKKRHTLQFVDLNTKEVILEESRPYIYNQKGDECYGNYDIIAQEHMGARVQATIGYQLPSAFVDKSKDGWIIIDPAFSTYIGGTNYDETHSTAYDSQQNIYFVGTTGSYDYPVSDEAYSKNFSASGLNIAITKTHNGSSLLFSTFIASLNSYDLLRHEFPTIIVDPSDDQAIICGTSYSDGANWPITGEAWLEHSDCASTEGNKKVGFIAKINSAGKDLIFSTLICGNKNQHLTLGSIFIDSTVKEDEPFIYFLGVHDGEVFPSSSFSDPMFKCQQRFGSTDIIFGKLNNDGKHLNASNCFGGSGEEISISPSIYVQGNNMVFQLLTNSDNILVKQGTFQDTKPTARSSKIPIVGSLDVNSFDITWTSYLAGSTTESIYSITMDERDRIWVSGETKSTDFPITAENCFQKSHSTNGSSFDGFFTKISGDGTRILYSSYLGSYDTDREVSVLQIKNDDHDRLLICSQGSYLNDPNEYDERHIQDFSNATSFTMIYDYTTNEVQYSALFGGWMNSCDYFGTNARVYVVAGYANDNLKTTEDAFQENNAGKIDSTLFCSTTECPTGYYKVTENDVCKPCIKGTYSSTPNSNSADDCLPCEEPYYSNTVGLSACKKCELGYFFYNPLTDPDMYCKPCESGFYSDRELITSEDECVECPPGRYTPYSGQSICAQCPRGQYQNENRSTTCKDCPEGTYNDLTGQIGCANCPSGTWNEKPAQASLDGCIKCQEGYYGIKEGGTSVMESCDRCPQGTWSNQTGLSVKTECTKCPPGSYNEKEGITTIELCKACNPGTYSTSPGLTTWHDCKQCEQHQISAVAGSTACTNCEIGSEPNPKQDGCIPCTQGYYKNNTDSNCVACEKDYFNNVEGSTFCLKCGLPNICLGAGKCNDGRDPDTFCTQCFDNYYLAGTECKKCAPNWAWSIWLTALLLLSIPLIRYRKKIQKAMLLKKNPIFEIYFTFLQLVASIVSMNINFTNLVDNSAISTLAIFNFDFTLIFNTDCYQNVNFYSKYLIFVLVPISLVLLCLLVYVTIRLVCLLLKSNSKQEMWSKLTNIFIYSITLGFRYLYITEAMACMRPFQATWQSGLQKKTLDYDPQIYTNDQRYQSFYPWFLFFLIFYIIVVPLFFIVILILAKRHNFSHFWGKKFGWLWEFYKPNRFWWEIPKMIFKCLIIIFPIIVGNLAIKYQLLSIFFIILAFNILILILKPYPNLIPSDKDKRNIKSFWEKISPEDLISVGLNLILMAIISSGIEEISNILFLLLNNVGLILAFMGTRKNFKEMWYKRKKIKKFKNNQNNASDDTDQVLKNNNLENNDSHGLEISTTSSKTENSNDSEDENEIVQESSETIDNENNFEKKDQDPKGKIKKSNSKNLNSDIELSNINEKK